MKKFTELLENYGENKLKSLAVIISEEPSEEEFNKEVEEVKKKDAGKIRNKKISDPAVQGVKEIEESEECDVRKKSISGKPKDGYLDNAGQSKPMTPDEKKKRYEQLTKSAKEIVKSRNTMKGGKVVEEGIELDERTLTSGEEDRKEDIVKGMKKSSSSFKKLYGDRAKNVMYATATKMAKEEFEEFDAESLTEEFITEWNASGHKQSKALKWLKVNGFEHDRHGKHPAYKHVKTGETVTAFNTHGNEVGAEALRNTRKQIIDHHKRNSIRYSEL